MESMKVVEIEWIKLKTDMFSNEKIDFIESLPESDAILVIWIKLLTLAGKQNLGGYIMLTENIVYTEEMLANRFKRPLNTVRLALQTFKKLGMIDVNENNAMFISNWEKHQNEDKMESIREYNRLAKQNEREKKKQKMLCQSNVNDNVNDISTTSQGNVMDCQGNVNTQIVDLDLDLDLITTTKKNQVTAESFYQNNIAPITEFVSQQIAYYLEDGVEESLIVALMQSSVSNNKRSWAYIEKCIKSNFDKGVKTLTAYRLAEAERTNKKAYAEKGGKANGSNGGNTGTSSGTNGKAEMSESDKVFYGIDGRKSKWDTGLF
jgi:predicted phage replisome organizer